VDPVRYPLPAAPPLDHLPRTTAAREGVRALRDEYVQHRVRFLKDPAGLAWATYFSYRDPANVPPPPPQTVTLKLGVLPVFDSFHELWWSEPEGFAALTPFAPMWSTYFETSRTATGLNRKQLGRDLDIVRSALPGAPRPPGSPLGALIPDPSRRRWIGDRPLPATPRPPPGPRQVRFWDRVGTRDGAVGHRELGGGQRSWLIVRRGVPIAVATTWRGLRQAVSAALALKDPSYRAPTIEIVVGPNGVHRVRWQDPSRRRRVHADFSVREDAQDFANEKRDELIAYAAPVFAFDQRALFLRDELVWYPAVGREMVGDDSGRLTRVGVPGRGAAITWGAADTRTTWTTRWIVSRLDPWLARQDLPYYTVVPDEGSIAEAEFDVDLPFDLDEVMGSVAPLRDRDAVEQVVRGTRWPVVVGVRGGSEGDRLGGVRPVFEGHTPANVVAYLSRGSRGDSPGAIAVQESAHEIAERSALARTLQRLYYGGQAGPLMKALFHVFPLEDGASDLFEIYGSDDLTTFREDVQGDPGALLTALVGQGSPASLLDVFDGDARKASAAILAHVTEARGEAQKKAVTARVRRTAREDEARQVETDARRAAARAEWDAMSPEEQARREKDEDEWDLEDEEAEGDQERRQDRKLALAEQRARHRAAEATAKAAADLEVKRLRAARQIVRMVETGQADDVPPGTLAAAQALVEQHRPTPRAPDPVVALDAPIGPREPTPAEMWRAQAVRMHDLRAALQVVRAAQAGQLDVRYQGFLAPASALIAQSSAAEIVEADAVGQPTVTLPREDTERAQLREARQAAENRVREIAARIDAEVHAAAQRQAAFDDRVRAAHEIVRLDEAGQLPSDVSPRDVAAAHRLLQRAETSSGIVKAGSQAQRALAQAQADVARVAVAEEALQRRIADQQAVLQSVAETRAREAAMWEAQHGPRENPSGFPLSSDRGLYRPRVPTIRTEIVQRGPGAFKVQATRLADGRVLTDSRTDLVYPTRQDAVRRERELLREYATRPRVHLYPDQAERISVERFETASRETRERAQRALTQALTLDRGGVIPPDDAIETYFQAGRGEFTPPRRRTTGVQRAAGPQGTRPYPRAVGQAPSVSDSLMNPRGVITRAMAAERKVKEGRAAQERGAALEAEGLKEMGTPKPSPPPPRPSSPGPSLGLSQARASTAPRVRKGRSKDSDAQDSGSPPREASGGPLDEPSEKALPPRRRSGKPTSERK